MNLYVQFELFLEFEMSSKKKIAAYFQPTCSRKVSVKFSIIGEITTLTFKMIENWVKALHDTLLNRRSRITFNLLM